MRRRGRRRGRRSGKDQRLFMRMQRHKSLVEHRESHREEECLRI